jgi:methylphosphonate synthase
MNGLKRNSAAAADDLGIAVEEIADIIAGKRPLTSELIARAAAAWPVNERDFFPVRDDAPDGVIVTRAEESEKTSRTFARGGADYYEYRDTAMSRLAMFRPEWIKMLCSVPGTDPNDPAVQWNNGHFLFQFTYFIGEVNYYYSWEGRRYCAAMRTGDSVAGMPYAPHSFACRDGAPGMILALTYGGRLLGDAQQELGALGERLAQQYAFGTPEPHAGALLGAQLENTGCTREWLARSARISLARLEDLLAGTETPKWEEREALAEALRINVRDLLPVVSDTHHGVSILRRGDVPRWPYPDGDCPHYVIGALAGTRVCPGSRGLEIEVHGDDASRGVLRTGLHQYCYVLDSEPVRLTWTHDERTHSEELRPGDSFYLKPFVPHSFTSRGRPGRVLALRIGGKVAGDAWLEAAAIGGPSLRRLAYDTAQWYEEAGATAPKEIL